MKETANRLIEWIVDVSRDSQIKANYYIQGLIIEESELRKAVEVCSDYLPVQILWTERQPRQAHSLACECGRVTEFTEDPTYNLTIVKVPDGYQKIGKKNSIKVMQGI